MSHRSSSASASPDESPIFDQPVAASAAGRTGVLPSNALNIIHPPASIFTPAHLRALRNHLELFSNPSGAPLNSFSPIRALQRIQVSYPTVDSAVVARRAMTNPGFFARFVPDAALSSVRVSFARPVPVVVGDGSDGSDDETEANKKKYLKAPTVDKLHFISPPPSPPAGWEVRFEDPPNKTTHPDDLLKGVWGGFAGSDHLRQQRQQQQPPFIATSPERIDSEMSGMEDEDEAMAGGSGNHSLERKPTAEEGVRVERSSASTTYFYETRRNSNPENRMLDEGDVPVVEDIDDSNADGVLVVQIDHPDDESAELQSEPKTITAHTSRPPAELMMQ